MTGILNKITITCFMVLWSLQKKTAKKKKSHYVSSFLKFQLMN